MYWTWSAFANTPGPYRLHSSFAFDQYPSLTGISNLWNIFSATVLVLLGRGYMTLQTNLAPLEHIPHSLLYWKYPFTELSRWPSYFCLFNRIFLA